MEWIEVNQILFKNKSEFPQDYILDLYKGCDLGCIYCDSRSQCYRIDSFDVVKGKKDCITLLNKELRHKKSKGYIGMGILSDPYNSCEEKEELTRKALQLILQYGFGVIIHTKSNLILRDLDLLKEINERYGVIINVSITTSNDEISKKIEKNVCPSSERFEIVRKCKQAGLLCGITMDPVLPFVTDDKDDLKKFIELALHSEADYIFSDMKVTLRDRQKEYYFNKLEEVFNGLYYQYKRTYNNRYHCETLKWKENYEYLKNECIKNGLYYQVDELKEWIENKKKDFEQISLFE